MKSTPINDVTDTAFWVATYRARETLRADALFKDPFASILIGKRGDEIAAGMQGTVNVEWSVIIRTRVIDAYIQAAIKAGIDTILNLGAGLDTRPYRMELPENLRWIEIDFPKVIEFKADKLKDCQPRCRLERLSLDLSDRKRRKAELEKIQGKVLVLTEGVVPYLSEDEVASLAKDLRELASVKYWVVDYFAPLVMKFLQKRKQMRNAPFLFNPPQWTEFFLAHGWRVQEMKYLTEEGIRLGRQPPMPFLFKLTSWLMSEERKLFYRRLTGYALFEKK